MMGTGDMLLLAEDGFQLRGPKKASQKRWPQLGLRNWVSFELARLTGAFQAEKATCTKALTKPALHRPLQRLSLAKAHDNTFSF